MSHLITEITPAPCRSAVRLLHREISQAPLHEICMVTGQGFGDLWSTLTGELLLENPHVLHTSVQWVAHLRLNVKEKKKEYMKRLRGVVHPSTWSVLEDDSSHARKRSHKSTCTRWINHRQEKGTSGGNGSENVTRRSC